MENVQVPGLQAVDNAVGAVIAKAFDAMDPASGTEAFRRFLARPYKEKIFYAKNDDIQRALRKLLQRADEPSLKAGQQPEEGQETSARLRSKDTIPAVIYYREQGIAGDQNQYVQVANVLRFISEKTVMGVDEAMRITTLPLTLTYSMVFLSWDRATIDAMALAWWGYVASSRSVRYRFTVPYMIAGERLDVGASLNAPREILTSAEPLDDDRRLWGSRTMVEINTQAIYGAKVEALDYFKLVGTHDRVYR